MNSKILKIIVAVIAALGIIGFAMVARAGEGTPQMSSAASFMVNVALVLLVAVVLVALVASLFSLVKNPVALKKTLLGLGVLLVLLAVSYFASSNGKVLGTEGNLLAAEGATSKWVGTGITYSLILGGIGLLFFFWDLLKGLVKS